MSDDDTDDSGDLEQDFELVNTDENSPVDIEPKLCDMAWVHHTPYLTTPVTIKVLDSKCFNRPLSTKDTNLRTEKGLTPYHSHH